LEIDVTKAYTAPYINFQGRAREAFEFYHSILGGKLTLLTFDSSGSMKAARPGDAIGYGRLEAEELRIIGSDGNPDYPSTHGNNISILLAGPDREDMTQAFHRLADGGSITMQLTDASWGSAGWLTDKFGITWNVDITK
jgi:PhnB protein